MEKQRYEYIAPFYACLYGELRAKAMELGYALAIHGSLQRDLDLIAVPWTKEAVPEAELAEALRQVAVEINGSAALGFRPDRTAEFSLAGAPGVKPHGRLGWTFSLGGPFVDLSVMPRRVEPQDTPMPVCGRERREGA